MLPLLFPLEKFEYRIEELRVQSERVRAEEVLSTRSDSALYKVPPLPKIGGLNLKDALRNTVALLSIQTVMTGTPL